LHKIRVRWLTYLLLTGAFLTLILLAAYLGLSAHPNPTTPDGNPADTHPALPTAPTLPLNDKFLHFTTFFLLTSVFYFILDTSRRRTLNLTFITCTVVLGIGSEFLQHLVPNGRDFDLWDIVANVVGSVSALGVCSWYHMRMLERKRVRRGYGAVATGEEGEDLELGERLGVGVGAQENGEVVASTATTAGVARGKNLEEEVDNWDENLDDGWEEETDEHTEGEGGLKTPSASSAGEGEIDTRKRVD
jgi:VanZ family protein